MATKMIVELVDTLPFPTPPYRIPAAIDSRVVIVELVEALASKGLTLSNAHGVLVIHRIGELL